MKTSVYSADCCSLHSSEMQFCNATSWLRWCLANQRVIFIGKLQNGWHTCSEIALDCDVCKLFCLYYVDSFGDTAYWEGIIKPWGLFTWKWISFGASGTLKVFCDDCWRSSLVKWLLNEKQFQYVCRIEF